VQGAVGINAAREMRVLRRELESGQPVYP
jgi:hypothetical protein